MRKFGFLLLLALSGFLVAQAAVITENQAKSMAYGFMGKQSSLKLNAWNTKTATLALAYTARGVAENDYYVFNSSHGGYIIVAADDCATPVLGYSDTGGFDYTAIPENMKWWLGEYARQIEYAKAHPGEFKAVAPKTLSKAVAPLLGATMWNQDAPFNNLCPTYTNSNGDAVHSATGCMATALAQVMYYHKWPLTGTGSHSYSTKINNTGDAQTLTTDFSLSTYAWDKMLPFYTGSETEEQNTAVAKLMYDAGVSMDMAYGESSGASDSYLIRGLITNFSYDKGVSVMLRDYYTQTQWDNTIISELDASRPVIYTGASGTGAHAFVCDGYSINGYFHINWGWGGMSNGYFLPNALTPDSQGIGGSKGGYNYGQQIIYNIKKDAGGALPMTMFSGSTLVPVNNSIAKDSLAKFTVSSLFNYGGVKTTFIFYAGFYDNAGNLLNAMPLGSAELDSYYGWNSVGLKLDSPITLPEGTYKMKLICSSDNGTTKVPVPVKTASAQYVDVTVSSDKITFSVPAVESPALSFTAITPQSEFYKTTQCRVSATIANTGAEYHDNVYLAFLDPSTLKLKAKSAAFMMDLDKNANTTLDFFSTVSVDAGSYKLGVVDKDSVLISGTPIDITVNAAPEAAVITQTVALTPKSSVMNGDDIEATNTIQNTGGYFTGDLEMLVCEMGSSSILSVISGGWVSLAPNESKEVTFKGEYLNGTAGTQYRAIMRNPTVTTSYAIMGNWIYFNYDLPTGISEPTAERTMLFPNPATDFVTVSANAPIHHLSVYSTGGALVLDRVVNSTNSASLDVSALAQGIYLLRIAGENTVQTLRLVKK